jgi:hypothetical protein
MTERRKQAWSKWRKLISQQAKSGENVAAFCRERGLCAPHFFAWRKRLAQAEAKKFVEVKVATCSGAAVSRVRVNPAIEIRLENHRSLLVSPGFDAGHLQAVLAVLEQRS